MELAPHPANELPHCPACQQICDGITPLEPGAVPSVGDWSLCMYCGAILRVGEPGRVVEAEEGGHLRLVGIRFRLARVPELSELHQQQPREYGMLMEGKRFVANRQRAGNYYRTRPRTRRRF
jgi:hypothetical protein